MVYDHPSISALAHFLAKLANDEKPTKMDKAVKISEMLSMVEKYSAHFPTHAGGSECKTYTGDVVLVTGTTGAYGSSLLGELVKSSQVSLIYALNRKGDKPLIERQRTMIEERELDLGILNSPKVVLLESDMHKDRLGLRDDTYEEVRPFAALRERAS